MRKTSFYVVAGFLVLLTLVMLIDVSVNYITNNDCKQKKGMLSGYNSIYSLEDKITANMLCAFDNNEDAW